MRLQICITCIIAILLFSCKKSSTEPVSVQWNISRVEGDTIGNIDQTIILTVYYPVTSSCDVFDKFEQHTGEGFFSFKAFGHTETGNCTDEAIEKSVTVNFTAVSSGKYELRFINRDNSYITHIIIVN